MSLINYPEGIIPHTTYFPLMDIDTLLNTQKIFVVRRSDKSKEDTFDIAEDEYILKEKAIEKKRVVNLSLNMLGAKFEIEHIRFSTKNKGSETWNGENVINICEYNTPEHFLEKTDDFCSIVFSANMVHNKQVPYTKNNGKELQKLKKIGVVRDQQYAKTKIKHSPTNLNYWHVELIIFDEAGVLVKKTDTAWVQEICGHILDNLICGQALPYLPDAMMAIPTASYIKK